MKDCLLWSAILLFYLSSFTSNPESPQTTACVAISNDAFNIFYIGIENTITVALPNVPIEQTKVTISNGILTKTEEAGKYRVIVHQEGETTIKLEGKTPDGKRITSNHVFDVQKFPTPLLGIDGQEGWQIPILDLWSSSGLYCMNNSLIEVEPIIEKFYIMVYLPRECDPLSYINVGESWGITAAKLIKRAEIGSYIYINNIHIRLPNGTIHKLDKTLSFKII